MKSDGSKVDFARYARQILLVEIGASGQARIGAATAAVRAPGLSGEVAALYAERAGFGAIADAPTISDAPTIDPGAPSSPPELPAGWVVTPAARAVLSGARAAQRALLAALAQPDDAQETSP